MIASIPSRLRILKYTINLYIWRIKNWLLYNTSGLIKKQIKTPLSIPIIIISYNQLFYLKRLVNFLLNRGCSNIVIIDNNSTYSPLLAYFDTLEQQHNDAVTIHRLHKNWGHLVFWENKELFELYSRGYYVVTDADINPLESVPEDFMTKFRKLLNKNKSVSKVGFSLYIDDIPDSNPNKDKIIKWEKRFWENKYKDYFINAIDTTFAMYRPDFKREEEKNFLKAIRTDKPYVARHGGWYINPEQMTEEQEYYLNTANNSSSWLMDKKGDLKNIFFKSHYNK
ncbi:MAG: glycosyltransferase family 2 protein [Vicingus serpentipes]|nr:glycosyltransferase family 2 protein [Vicingus serpentipes]